MLASSQGGGGACRPPLPPYRQNMGIGFGPNLIPSGKLACQPANDRGKREAKCGIVAWSPTKRHRKATLEAGGLEMAVLLQNYNIVAPLHASGAPVEHTNFISTTLQRNRETEKRRGEEKRREEKRRGGEWGPPSPSQRSEQIRWSHASRSRAERLQGSWISDGILKP